MEPVSECLREYWLAALGGSIPIEDDTDYFEAGGHSFMATMIISRINSTYEINLPLRVLFDNPLFADFVAATTAAVEEVHGKDASVN